MWGLSWQERPDREEKQGIEAEAAEAVGRAQEAKVETAEWGSLLSGRQRERLMAQRW